MVVLVLVADGLLVKALTSCNFVSKLFNGNHKLRSDSTWRFSAIRRSKSIWFSVYFLVARSSATGQLTFVFDPGPPIACSISLYIGFN